MDENIWTSLLSFGVGAYLLFLWSNDCRGKTAATDKAPTHLMPGSSLTSGKALLLASLGAVAIVFTTTLVEVMTETFAEQSRIAPYFILAMFGAAIIEEIVFRGYFVIQKKGPTGIILSSLFFSLIFAVIHPYLWVMDSFETYGLGAITTLRLEITTHGLLSTISIFALSLWFYYCRFSRFNPSRSLLPCFFAHAFANLAVYIIKYSTGYIT